MDLTATATPPARARRATAGTTMPLPVEGISSSTFAGAFVVASPSSTDVVLESVGSASSALAVVVSVALVVVAVSSAFVVVGAAVVSLGSPRSISVVVGVASVVVAVASVVVSSANAHI